VKPVAKAAGLLSTAEEDITRAAKPGKRNVNFISDWALAKDRYIEEVDKGFPRPHLLFDQSELCE
jgi:hypothetical protein